MRKKGYLKKDRMVRHALKRCWFVDAWRVVDEHGNDLVQPWCETKQEAIETAAEFGIKIKGDLS